MSAGHKKRQNQGSADEPFSDISYHEEVNVGNAVDGMESNQLAQIQEILFGDLIRDFDRRLHQLQEHMTKGLQRIRDGAEERLESLETHVEKRVDDIGEQIDSVRNQQSQSATSIISQIGELANSLRDGLKLFDKKQAESEGRLREFVTDEASKLRHEQHELSNRQQAELQREARVLQEAKADRAVLGDLLNELAARLKEGIESNDRE